MNLPVTEGNFNKDYRLPLKRLYGRRILENHEEGINGSRFGGFRA
jgi:hypothetical protein